uniref:Receptor-like serine/threonine-protein kinase ALE2 n=1 Tax=Anthurium amnicola TaxID=1678845 RepID=A0A1D1Y391_9ARAE
MSNFVHWVCSCRRRGELRRVESLLLLKFFIILSCTEFIGKAALTHDVTEVPSEVSYVPKFAGLGVGHSGIAPAVSKFPLLGTLPSIHKQHRKHFAPQGSPLAILIPAQPPIIGRPSLNSSPLSKPSINSQDPAPSSAIRPPALTDIAPASSNDSLVPSGLAQPPFSHHSSGCCGLNMVKRRGSRDCHCVYPVKLELFLFNVSLSSNWTDKFLEELASQLHLRVSQFEIDNFYVVGVSGLNITMYITPHTGVSFSNIEVKEMNTSLTFHYVRIDGGYRLLNLTWSKPLAPPPAPAFVVSPKALPPTFSVHGSNNDHRTEKHSSLGLLLGISAGSLIILVIFILVISLCTTSKEKKATAVQESVKRSTTDLVSVEGSLPHPTSTRFLSYEELKEATNNFEPASMLGEGGFGRVFKGVLNDGTPVAIKKLSSGGHQGDKEFLVEVEMLSRLHHRNLVKLVGYYSSRDSSQNLLCYELVPNGSLESWLHGSLGANCLLDWHTRMKIALDAARGLAYLHEDSQPCVIHRDFKASNILLENNFHAKVSDFGLAKQAPEGRANSLSTRVMGTFGYVAPEYAMTGHLLVKSDVYSYGVVLLELLTGRRPVDMSQPSGQENLVTWKIHESEWVVRGGTW